MSGHLDHELCEIKGNDVWSSQNGYIQGVPAVNTDKSKDKHKVDNLGFYFVGGLHKARALQVQVGDNLGCAQFCTTDSTIRSIGESEDLFAIGGLEKGMNKNA